MLASAWVAAGAQASPAQVWTDWTSMTSGSAGSAFGTMTFSGSPAVGVTYSGELLSGSQTACGTAWFSSSYAAYDGKAPGSSVVSYNSPLPCDMIQANGVATTYQFVFSAPVVDPFMAFVSVGRSGTPLNYDFVNAPFDIADEGAGAWGDGSLVELSGDVLRGEEGHGVIRFSGTYSTLSWTISPSEHWHGFTVGAAGLGATTVPEPFSIALLGTGLAAIGGVAARRKRRGVADA